MGKFGLKKWKLFVLPENWHTCTCTHRISKMSILISILVFSTSNLNLEDADSYSEFSEIPNLNQFFGQIWVEKFEFSTLPGSWYTEYLADVIVIIQSKFWRKRWQWIIILSACCSHIFIVAKSKKQNHSTKECWINGIIVAIKIFLIKSVLLQPKLVTRSRLHIYRLLHNRPST